MDCIGIEATGCDGGFFEVFEGARRFKKRNKGLDLVLIAGRDNLPKELLNLKQIDGVYLEQPEHTFNFQNKADNKKSSIYRALEMHKSGDIKAIIAPGETKATVFYSFKLFNRILGVRPAIACNFSGSVVIDVGANIQCKPKHYYQFAEMGYTFSKHYLKIDKPLIGIITNGTEMWKGDKLAQESKPLIDTLKDKGYDIIDGFFEPNSFRDPNKKGFRKGLVGVTNGVFGNGILKAAEFGFEVAGDILKDEFYNEPFYNRVVAGHTFKRIRDRVKKRIDYRSFATAPLLGVEGYVMICHGRSDAEAIESAIDITARYLGCGINEKLREEIERCS